MRTDRWFSWPNGEPSMLNSLVCFLIFLMSISLLPILYDWVGQSSSPKFDRLVAFSQNVFVSALFMLLTFLATH